MALYGTVHMTVHMTATLNASLFVSEIYKRVTLASTTWNVHQ